MLGDSEVGPTIAVKDLAEATRFYGGVLGLGVEKENEHEVVYKCGNSHLAVYASEYAGSNKATYATWEVEELEDKVEALKDQNVSFEHYDFPGTKLEGDVHLMGDEKAVWFKDPDGNILCLHSTLE